MKKIWKILFGITLVFGLLLSLFSFKGIAEGFLEDNGIIPRREEAVLELSPKEDHLDENNKVDESKMRDNDNDTDIDSKETIEDDSSMVGEQETVVPDASNKRVYLTFDDGPTQLTPQVLNILEEYDVKATFFMIGQLMERHPDKVLEVYNSGHMVLPHSYSHNYSIYTTFDTFYEDFYKVEDVYLDILGFEAPPIFRFPGGSSNHSSFKYGGRQFMPRLTADVKDKGYYYVDWNVDSGDTGREARNPKKLLENVINGSKGKDILIVLFHDTAQNTAMLEILPDVINYYQENQYQFMTFHDIEEEELETLIRRRLINKPIVRD